MKIADIRNPELFQRLVRKLYIADRGHEFQVVDDSGGDKGNDGYDAARRLMLAIYCPEKPDSADYRSKAMADLEKAAELARTGAYGFDSWAFVTPTPLREPIQATVRQRARDLGLAAVFISDEHLEDLYRRYPHVHDDFPDLEYPNVSAKLDRILAAMNQEGSPAPEPAVVTPQAVPSILSGFADPTLLSIHEELMGGSAARLPELERIRLEAGDARDRLAATVVQLEYFTRAQDWTRVVETAARALPVAREHDFDAERAIFCVELAYVQTLSLVHEDMQNVANATASSLFGVPVVTDTEWEAARTRLDHQRRTIEDYLEEAIAAANRSGDTVAKYNVALRLGHIATQRHFPFRMAAQMGTAPGAGEAIASFRAKMLAAYDQAIGLAKATGDVGALAVAYSNYANDLVAFGDYERGLEHAEYALRLAREAKDELQVQKTTLLLEKIERERPRR